MREHICKRDSISRAIAAGAFCIVLVLCCAQAGAAEAGSAGVETIKSPSLGGSLFRVAGALAIVFAVLFGGAWLFRNWQRLAIKNGRAPKLNILEVKSLGSRHAIYVVGYERQRFLLASAPTGISMLTPLPDSDEAAVAPNLPSPNFAEALSRALSPLGSKGGKGL